MDAENTVETTGETVDKAVATGLAQLGVTAAEVIVEVIEEPRQGVFGIGSKPAKVRLKLLRPPTPEPVPAPPADMPDPSPKAEGDDAQDAQDAQSDHDDEDESNVDHGYSDEPIDLESDEAKDGVIGREVLLNLLKYMSIEAEVEVRRAKAAQDDDHTPWVLDIQGENTNLLIGRRGETLSALQYITRLIVSRQLQQRTTLVIDADGYKSRRSEKLRQIAQRMADQAVQQARPLTLEPMPPNERRIIHLELREREDVETNSIGEGNSRKVTISPK
jgi:spoIIIJ-associated protein